MRQSRDGMCLGARVELTARSMIFSSLQAVVSASAEYWRERGEGYIRREGGRRREAGERGREMGRN